MVAYFFIILFSENYQFKVTSSETILPIFKKKIILANES